MHLVLVQDGRTLNKLIILVPALDSNKYVTVAMLRMSQSVSHFLDGSTWDQGKIALGKCKYIDVYCHMIAGHLTKQEPLCVYDEG